MADRLNKGFEKDFRIFKGIESDILADGSLDYPDEVLERFDFVVASIHGRFRLDRKTQTERLLKAISNRHTTIIGHMTARQLMRRPGYDIDVEKVLRACARRGVAVEINAHPWRLDLDWRWHQAALDFGYLFSINPGGIPADRVLNAKPLDEIIYYLRHTRLSAGLPPRFATAVTSRAARSIKNECPASTAGNGSVRRSFLFQNI